MARYTAWVTGFRRFADGVLDALGEAVDDSGAGLDDVEAVVVLIPEAMSWIE
jgi:hypothetical protein